MRPNTIEWDPFIDPAKRLFSTERVTYITINYVLGMRERGVYRNAVAYWHATLHARKRDGGGR